MWVLTSSSAQASLAHLSLSWVLRSPCRGTAGHSQGYPRPSGGVQAVPVQGHDLLAAGQPHRVPCTRLSAPPPHVPGGLGSGPVPRACTDVPGGGRVAAGTSQRLASQVPVPPLPQPKSALEAEGQQLPTSAPRPGGRSLAHVGRTGGGMLPCCGKEAVEILEPPISLAHCDFHAQVPQEEDKIELKTELLAQEPDPHSVPELESLEVEPSPCPTRQPEPKPEPVKDPGWKVTTLVLCHGSSRQPQTHRHQRTREEAPVCPKSCSTQTSKHLFWADKLVQVSEHSLLRASGRQGTRLLAPASEKPPKVPSTHPAPRSTRTQLPPGTPPQAMGLVEVVHFATALAVAPSSCMDLPSLGPKTKAPSQKAVESPPGPVQPATDKQELLEKPPEARGQEDKSSPYCFLDFSSQRLHGATVEGEMKILQATATRPQPQGAKEESVPGTKKGNPLLLKIHFTTSSAPNPEK
ncbi:spermatogenesis-associated protein 32 isoform X2 [Fukomys damarensis]|uniref:spermatogenesis-associated protein 32 isoform X2 n=1 Tax=Fukomys damarensis TaxID=885580 RepID=UPI00053F7A7E|nr:spermatogenesis-associated protein 32 isoform X2 [Fukomys damarensis]